VKKGARPLIDEDEVSKDEWMKEYVSVMKQCWQQQADKRPTIHQTLIKLIELQQKIDPQSAQLNLADINAQLPIEPIEASQQQQQSQQQQRVIDIQEMIELMKQQQQKSSQSQQTTQVRLANRIEMGIRVVSVNTTQASESNLMCGSIRVWCVGRHNSVCLLNCFGDGSLSGDKPLVIAEDESKKHFNSLLLDCNIDGSGMIVTCSDGSVSRLKVERCKEYTSHLSGHLKWVGYTYSTTYWMSFSGSERETRLVFGDASNKSPTQRSILFDRKAETPVSKCQDTSDTFVVRCAEAKK
jgi:hypothetical protein